MAENIHKYQSMNKLFIIITVTICVTFLSCDTQPGIKVFYNNNSSILSYGVARLSKHVKDNGWSVTEHSLGDASRGIFILTPNEDLNERLGKILSNNISDIKNDGYKIVIEDEYVYLIGLMERGCLYGIMDVIEQLGNPADAKDILVGPRPACLCRLRAFHEETEGQLQAQ